MTLKLWNTIENTLKCLPYPGPGYEQIIDIPEFTFLGVQNQPDFGRIKIWFYGNETTIELKSLKEYLYQYRNTVISYERTIDVLYNHIVETYNPNRVRIEIEFRPRGGISSTMVADSDWKHLGGTDTMWKYHN